MPDQQIPERYLQMIKDNLEPQEKIELMSRQSRWWPAVPFNSIFAPVLVFITNERLIIVSRHWLGLKRNTTIIPLTSLRTTRLEKGLILASVIMGQVGSTHTSEVHQIYGFHFNDARAILVHLTKTVQHLNRAAGAARPLPPSTYSKEDKCYNCGTPIIKGEKYCYHCGVRLF